MKVAIYARVSTEEQNAQTQVEMCKEYCRRMDYEVYNAYTDVFSGTADKRPSFNILIEDMRSLKFDTIMVTKLDRLGRSLQHLLGLLDEMTNKKVQFIAIQQNIDTSTASGKMQMHILGAFAEFERNLISERTKDGLARAKNVGKRGKDKKPRSNEGYVKRWRKTKKKKVEYIPKAYKRKCKRCKNTFETFKYHSRICRNCYGKNEGV